jgi:hypothetical protein
LNPILSSKNAGAPTGAGAMAQTPDYSKSYGSGVANALMIAQTQVPLILVRLLTLEMPV